MNCSVLGEWREGKVRPLPGNAPHDRLVSRAIVSPKSICDDPFPATRFPQLGILSGPSVGVFKACGIYLVRCGESQNQTPAVRRFPLNAPVAIPFVVTTTGAGPTVLSSGVSTLI